MAKYVVKERTTLGHDFCVCDPAKPFIAVIFNVSDYGLDEARRRAEAEAKWLNENAEKWVAVIRDSKNGWPVSVEVQHKETRRVAGSYCSQQLGLDLARAEADRLCRILNERDASK